MLHRFYKLAVVCLTVVSLAACGDDETDKNNDNNTNNVATNNANNTNNTNNAQTNNANNTNNAPTNNANNTNNVTQCAAVLEDCTLGNATNPNFICEDVGAGAKCYEACTPRQDETAQYPCGATQACVSAQQAGPTFCFPSQCAGWTDDTGCDAIVAGNPGEYPNGATCSGLENDAYVCSPAGAGAEGAACENDAACGAGLLCFDDKCSAVCDDDAQCTGAGERCWGADDDILDTGVGICGVGCDSYSTGQCATGEGCFPATPHDGFCDTVGTKTAFQDCAPRAAEADPNECGEGMRCGLWQEADAAAGIPEIAKCFPYCNGLEDGAAADGTCPTAGQECLGTGGDDASASSGFCIETCEVADYGTNGCAGDSMACTPAADGANLCFPGGDVALGDECDVNSSSSCAEGGVCTPYGDGTAKCVSMCETGTSTNSNLECGANEACRALSDGADLGVCANECASTDWTDASCPDNLKTCLPNATQSYCSASGSDAAGAACENVGINSCVTGQHCQNDANLGLGSATNAGTCQPFCDPMGDDSACGTNETCVRDFTFSELSAGACMDRGQNTIDADANLECTELDKACHQRGICIDLQGSNFCMILCDPDSTEAGNCPSGRKCTLGQTDDATGEFQSWGFEPFGLCLEPA